MGGPGIMRCGWSLGPTVESGGGRSGKAGWIHPTGHPESQAEGWAFILQAKGSHRMSGRRGGTLPMLGFQSCNSASYQALCVTQIREATGWFKRPKGGRGFADTVLVLPPPLGCEVLEGRA